MGKCARYDDTCDCPACEDDRNKRILECDFRSLRDPTRQWTARFDLGDVAANSMAAVKEAWDHAAQITGQRLYFASQNSCDGGGK
jgi:hypothetical protein